MRRRIIPCIALALLVAFTVTGCESVTDVFDGIVDAPANNDAPSSENGVPVTADNTMTIDRNLAVPVFKNPVGGSSIIPQDTKVELDATALSSDGGKITYQWYTNNVNSNGGGTSVNGASGAVYTPDTSEVGTKYYYAVARNEHQNTYMMGTGPVYEVIVIKKGTFTTDEFGGVRYLSDDGTYPSSMWVLIENETYYFNEEGYMSVGWVDLGGGKVYYFTEDGKLLRGKIDKLVA